MLLLHEKRAVFMSHTTPAAIAIS